MDLFKYKIYQHDIWYIGLGYDRSFPINLSTQFNHKNPRKCAELNRLLNEKVNEMKSILVINNVLKDRFINENDVSNKVSFTTNESLPKTTDSSITINFIKNIILHNDIEEDSTIERIIEYVKKIQLKEMEVNGRKII